VDYQAEFVAAGLSPVGREGAVPKDLVNVNVDFVLITSLFEDGEGASPFENGEGQLSSRSKFFFNRNGLVRKARWSSGSRSSSVNSAKLFSRVAV